MVAPSSFAGAPKESVLVAVVHASFPGQRPDRLEYSRDKILFLSGAAAARGIGIVLLPELALGGFGGSSDEWWGAVAGNERYVAAASTIAAEAARLGINIVFGAAIWDETGFFNGMVLADAWGNLSQLRKKTTVPGSRYFNTPTARAAPRPFLIGGLKVAPLVCAEAFWPEVLAGAVFPRTDAAMISAAWWDDDASGSAQRDLNILAYSKAGGVGLISNHAIPGRYSKTYIASKGAVVAAYDRPQDGFLVAEVSTRGQGVKQASTVVLPV